MLSGSNPKSIKTSKNHAKKKTTRYYEQDIQKVKEYLEQIKDIAKEKIIYVDETGIHLIPELPQGAVIIMDNASFHRKKRLYELAKQHKVKIIFLPPYSPELNPIEHFWHWLKKRICDLLKFSKNLDEIIFSIFQVL